MGKSFRGEVTEVRNVGNGLASTYCHKR